ncbi:hypothetical protein L1O03_11430 [Corynebacterium uropygiale]|uniref:Uncharacterized protein n=1 Tax=Corynebacterium uropygiale TaxID=1775911 RepID=A0A9X1U085_9CORY|nr:hypothetical protein [Corynebacterium uropygiale]MCF4007776.1 hypothetical protein [Corynebacterium uropygiale]
MMTTQAGEKDVFPVHGSGIGDRAGEESSGQQAPSWVAAVIMFLVGIVVVLVGLWASQYFAAPVTRWGYVPVMFVFKVIMMIGGGLMTSGFMRICSRLFSARS